MIIDKRAAGAGLAIFLVAGAGDVRAQGGATTILPEIQISQTPLPTTGNNGLDINKVPADVSIVTAQRLRGAVQALRHRRDHGTRAGCHRHQRRTVQRSLARPVLPGLRHLAHLRHLRGPRGLRERCPHQRGVRRSRQPRPDPADLDRPRSDIYTNNPIFGLNALGGAINFTTKNGFNFHGGDATILGGSFGRANGYMEYGKQVDNYSFYFAADGYYDGGYRPFGAQNAQRTIADLGYRSQDSEVHLIGQFGRSLLGVQGVTPVVLVNNQYNSVFTTPQSTNNQAGLVQLTGSFDVGHHWTIGSNFYIRQFDQYHVDGNDADVEDCGGALKGTICLPDDDAPANATRRQRQFIGLDGNPIASVGTPGVTNNFPYGTTAKTSTHTTSEGVELQAVNKDTYYGHDNYFVFGGSVDTSQTSFTSTTSLGVLNPAFQNELFGAPGAGDVIDTRGNVGFDSTFVHSNATYYGVFALDTFNVTKAFALTAGARGEHRRHQPERRERQRPEPRLVQQLQPHQPGGRRHLRVHSGLHRLRRLFRSQPRADAARERVLEQVPAVRSRDRARVRPAAEAGRRAHLRGRRPRHGPSAGDLRRRQRHLQGRLLPHDERQRHRQRAERAVGPGLLRQRTADAAPGRRGRSDLRQGDRGISTRTTPISTPATSSPRSSPRRTIRSPTGTATSS